MDRLFWAARALCVCMARRQASSWNLDIMICDAALSLPAGDLEEQREWRCNSTDVGVYLGSQHTEEARLRRLGSLFPEERKDSRLESLETCVDVRVHSAVTQLLCHELITCCFEKHGHMRRTANSEAVSGQKGNHCNGCAYIV